MNDSIPDPIREALHRARTALRDASLDYGVMLARRVKPGRRTGQQAGQDALRRIDVAITDLRLARDALALALGDDLLARTDGAVSA